MRDAERLREKMAFSLEGREVWALSLSALLVLGGVFAIGLAVGRRTAPLPAAAQGELAAMDAEARPRGEARKAEAAAPKPAAPPAAEAAEAREKARPEPQKPVLGAALLPAARPSTVVAPPARPVQVAAATPIALTPPPRELGAYTVQIGASQERLEAQRLEARARAAGLKPYVAEADLGHKGTWYRVRVGAFRDKDAANQFRRDVERELRATAVVMPSR